MTCKPTIHVIDDDPAILASLSLLLTAEGYAVHTHQSAQIFLDTVRQSDSGCVVTDIHMPEINGLDLLAEMNERRVSMPVIIMTGQGNAQLVVAAMIQGAFDFFRKPFNADVLLASIRRALMCGDESKNELPTPCFAVRAAMCKTPNNVTKPKPCRITAR